LNEENLITALTSFHKKKIAVIGDVGIDRYTQGSVDRISPEAPVPILAVEREYLKLGLAANVADNVVALGGAPMLVGVVGRDQDSKDFKALARLNKIQPQFLVEDPTRRTILKERLVAETQQLLRVDFEDVHALEKDVRKKVRARAISVVAKCDAVIIEDYAKGLLDRSLVRDVVAVAKRKKIPVLIDPHLKSPVELYTGATCLTPNRREAEALSRIRITNDKTLRDAGNQILQKTKASCLIITLGGGGMAIFRNAGRKPTVIPTFAQEVYDVSGAGDTVISVLALAFACGVSLEDSAMIANLAAGIEVGKRGTATVSQEEIIQFFQRMRLG